MSTFKNEAQKTNTEKNMKKKQNPMVLNQQINCKLKKKNKYYSFKQPLLPLKPKLNKTINLYLMAAQHKTHTQLFSLQKALVDLYLYHL